MEAADHRTVPFRMDDHRPGGPINRPFHAAQQLDEQRALQRAHVNGSLGKKVLYIEHERHAPQRTSSHTEKAQTERRRIHADYIQRKASAQLLEQANRKPALIQSSDKEG